MVGENPPRLWGKGALERGQEMARRSPAVTGFECPHWGNSGGTTDNFVRPEPEEGSGRFAVPGRK